MSDEKVGDYKYDLQELVKGHANTREYALGKNFVVGGQRVSVDDLYTMFQENLEEAGYPFARKGNEDKGLNNMSRAVDSFLGRFTGQSFAEVCTMLAMHSERLVQLDGIPEDWLRDLVKQSAQKDLGVAQRALTQDRVKEDPSLVKAWQAIEQGLKQFLPTVDERNSPSPADVKV
jgi:hypothetical protein